MRKEMRERLRKMRGEFNRWLVVFKNRFPALPHNRMTCPARMNPFAAHQKVKNLDRWERWGADRCCSFCGSWHPDEFLRFVDQVIASNGKTHSVDLADSREKFYVHRPEVGNAYDGAIKFKKYHFRTVEEFNVAVPKINEALRMSGEALRERWKRSAEI